MKNLLLLGTLCQVSLFLAVSGQGYPQSSDENNEDMYGRRIYGASNPFYYERVSFVVKLALRYITREGVTSWNCTGTALSNRVVLTSSACVNKTGSPPTLISLHFINQKEQPMLIYPSEIHISPTDGDNQNSSLVVLKIGPNRKPMTGFNTYNMAFPTLVSTAANESVVKSSFILGWGQVNNDGIITNVIQKSEVYTTEIELCQIYYDSTITTNNTCILEYNQGKCLGNEGGPLLIPNKGCSYILLGVNIKNPTTCAEFEPSVYIRVYPHVQWISSFLD